MKKTFYLLGFLLLTLCLGGCSKDEKEPYDDALQMLVGKWHSYGPMDEIDGGNHGFTRSETIEGNTVTQEITITSDSRFHWQLIYFFPQVWRGGEFGRSWSSLYLSVCLRWQRVDTYRSVIRFPAPFL